MTTDDLPDLLGELTVAERCAVRLVDDIHRCAATSHVLSGVERYERLVTRVQSAALSSPDIPRFLTSVAVKLDSPSITGAGVTDAITATRELRMEVLQVLRDETTAVVALARMVATDRKEGR